MKGIFAVLLCGASCVCQGQTYPDSVMMERIYATSFVDGEAYKNLRYLTKEIGHRIAGSPQAGEAVQWSRSLMQELPFDRVYLQDVKVPYWERGAKEEAFILPTREPLKVLALGGSVATPAGGLEAEVIEVELLSELRRYGDAVAGKIVFVNKPWDESIVETGVAYGLNSSQRSRGPAEAAKLGAVAYLFRSLSSSPDDDFPHTGGTRYVKGIDSIPALAISAVAANRLSEVLKENPKTRIHIKNASRWNGMVDTHNVIAEWTGSEKPDEIITIGGHIDSWDVGEGAHDNGTGTMGTLDAIRTLMKLGYKPKHTIRLVFYMNEENGVHGATRYGEAARDKKERLVAAIESDAGGFAPRGFDIKSSAEKVAWIQQHWKPLFEQKFWVSRFFAGSPGVDSGVWGQHFPNTMMFNFRPDPHRYFDIHHTDKDVFEAVDRRELQSGVAALASLLYLLDQQIDEIGQK
ncbi:peptidase M28-like protein [Sphingobacterium allocomposti]|uniref:Carboxypeptidase Q n=1 Tax=Sphingobacterium allocomposti TaxID=415956 RepID=A0A5S5DLS7_9SPHI|nr:M20/M25/M40 family metallo-hydrolase [Sphingobacterium composti Yoo et al. 2007 non Ten et al. 2007]TYP96328.1 peptidase M28-like protein [Sphingobacterium composti Yoo et al. 2007 non Ten et al. 2007]HLS94082.1 M20/M25/M40 family metallo-hydrolase [Sphingobacterium sp.]